MNRSSSPTPAPTVVGGSLKTPADTNEESSIAGVPPHNEAERPADWPQQSAVWLLDGFNVLHAALFTDRDRTSWWGAEHRERLITAVREFADAANEIWIVFDGKRDDEPDARRLRTSGGIPIFIVFAPSADDWLVRQVRSCGAAETISVVTRDRRVGGRVRHKGASVVAPARFLDLCKSV